MASLSHLVEKSLDYFQIKEVHDSTFVEVKEELPLELDLIQTYGFKEVSLMDSSFETLQEIADGFFEVIYQPENLKIKDYDLSDFQFKPFG